MQFVAKTLVVMALFGSNLAFAQQLVESRIGGYLSQGNDFSGGIGAVSMQKQVKQLILENLLVAQPISEVALHMGLQVAISHHRTTKANTTDRYYEYLTEQNAPTREFNSGTPVPGLIVLPNIGLTINETLEAGVFSGVGVFGQQYVLRKFKAHVSGPYLNIIIGDRLVNTNQYDAVNKMLNVGLSLRLQ